jgi:hypothetical protein
METSIKLIKCLSFEKRLLFMREMLEYEERYKNSGGTGDPNDGSIGKNRGSDQTRISDNNTNSVQNSSPVYFNINSPIKHSTSHLSLINEIFCERPYALYSFFLNLNTNPYYLRKSYWRIGAQEIEELVRCAGERAMGIVEVKRSREKRKKMKEEMW